MKCLFLYNPASGKGRIAGQTAYIRRRLEEAYDIVEIVETKSAEDMEARAREGAARFDVILFAGGDGTFNRILQGVGERGVRLGYIPGGTTNDTARSLGIPRSVKGALNVILAGNCAAIDVMRLNGTHYAVYVAAAGAFTRATYSTGRSLKRKFGILAYAVEALRHEMKFRVFPVTVTCDGRRFEETTVLILNMNGRSIAGLKANKRSSMRDGKVELALIRQVREPNFVRRMGAYASLVSLMLFGGNGRSRHILRLKGSHFLIETDGDVVWDLDGEKGMRGDLHVDVLSGHMKLFVPRKKKI